MIPNRTLKRIRGLLSLQPLMLRAICRNSELDYVLLTRRPIPGRGTDESYLVCGNFFQGLRGRLSYLRVRPYGNFGNNYHQLVFASAIAEALGNIPVYHSFNFFNSSDSDNSLLRFDTSKTVNMGGCGLYSQFFYREKLNSILNRLDAEAYCKISDKHVTPALALNRYEPEDIICVNIRGGDIFIGEGTSRYYTQPPLSFYLAAIAHAKETYGTKRIKVVYQDRKNPVVDALEARLTLDNDTFEMFSGTIAEDAEQILNAKFVIMPQSTFTDSLLLMSHGIQAAYAFHRPYRINELQYRLPAIHLMQDIKGKYIKPGEWRNTTEQHQLMLNYPSGSLGWEKSVSQNSALRIKR